MRIWVVHIMLDCGGIFGLQISQTSRLDLDQTVVLRVTRGCLRVLNWSLAAAYTVEIHVQGQDKCESRGSKDESGDGGMKDEDERENVTGEMVRF